MRASIDVPLVVLTSIPLVVPSAEIEGLLAALRETDQLQTGADV